jgi:hypothetical protein
MASINNVSFAIDADHLHDRASISVSCDIEFTDVEVNAINMLGLRYRVQCLIFNKDLWEREPVAILDEWTLARLMGRTVSKREHVAFNTYRQMTDLHTHFLSKDKLQAEVQLVNEETGDSVASRSPAPDTATPRTPAVWPSRVANRRPVLGSQSCTDLSALPVASRPASADSATPQTPPLWP